ncbi:MAG: RNA polymerase sigma factor [Oscillospiraceae bacterium]|nr:RNA polymerase sigma factor [Oscillospiraceae bacterium]MBR2890162.1 RNA polymerase sigma factor [Oscillospiraceae bacterium]
MKQLLAELFDQYYKDIYTYLYSLCRDASLSEDLTSEVFVEAVGSIAGFRWESDVKTWLFTIARRRWIAHLKRKNRQIPTIPIHELFDAALPASQASLDGSELVCAIQEALSAEPELTRRVWKLRLEGYSYFEIGTKCGMSENSARVLFFRTKGKVRNHLQKEGFLL